MTITMNEFHREPVRLDPFTGLCLVLLLVLLSEFSRAFTIQDMPMSAIWPSTGIMAAATMVLGYRSLWLTMGSMLFWSLALQGTPVAVALLSVAGQGAGAAMMTRLMQQYWRKSENHRPLPTQLGIYSRGALIGGALSAFGGAIGFTYFMPVYAENRFLDVWVVYWAFEAMSITLFLPLAYFLLRSPGRFRSHMQQDWRRKDIRLWLMVIAALLLIAWLSSVYGGSEYAAVIGFAFFPALCWLVLQARSANVALAVPAFSALFVAFSLHGWAGLPTIESIPELVRSLLLVGGLAIMVQMIAAITAERVLLLRKFRTQAGSDYLTGLENDRAFAKRLQSLLAQPTSESSSWLCLMQVLQFDQLEDMLGFQDSQHLEKLLAARLMGSVGPHAGPTRLGDGSYAFILESTGQPSLTASLDRIYQSFNNEQFSAGDYRNTLRISLGAVPLDGSLSDHSHYLSAATQAALMARQQLHRVLVVEDIGEMMNQRRLLTQRLETLKSALAEERMELHAQRIQPMHPPEEKLHYEILLRLRDPQGELLSPGEFLPIAETFGFMMEIDRWVIRNTLEALSGNPGWLSATAKCAINLAGSSLSSGELVDYIRQQLDRTGIPPGQICFEITETERIPDREVATTLIAQLRGMGCSVSLDDFGTGLATFDYLRSFEVDFLKIDGVFIRQLESRPTDRSMVRAICHVARDMGLKTIAEFVEGESLVRLLSELGVDYGQGFGISRPQPLSQLLGPYSGAGD
ncbi:MAG: EAL domain-containing protein [Oleiphilaceae bacterium]|nr:EAL domain-containing protein [Oleiphilaceae bacterium]